MSELSQKYNIVVTCRHVQISEPMKAYAVDKISKLDHFASRIIDVNVIMDIQKLQQRVEIIMQYGHTFIKSTGVSNDMYVSIDLAVSRLQAQLKRYLTRLHDWRAKNHAMVEVPEQVYRVKELELATEEAAEEEVEAINEAIEKETKKQEAVELHPHSIVRVEQQPLRILTDDEAIMKMELTQNPCIVYRGEVDRKLKVIYRRADGDYGVVSPE